jgi:hypothetical protein
MANIDKGEFPLTIGGDSYTFVFNTAAMMAAEAKASTPQKEVTWDDILASLSKGSAKTFVVFFWAGLQKYHPTLTIERVIDLIDVAGGPSGLFALVQQAQQSATPDPEDVKELRPHKAQAKKKRSRGARFT